MFDKKHVIIIIVIKKIKKRKTSNIRTTVNAVVLFAIQKKGAKKYE